ncbi:MAG: hypothetical protein A3G11_01895 [Candidatus Lloydbacteria bacterium RIFCSPLOWO2_12_FULL_51_9]|uniref:Uncharacterized protein n=1 Tax=Candidatus Lloydbacteria bacterium RIFCSPLOWO2_12_FULL_51_9 TaxID=1798669 RepID=A0A1G2DUS1_9BACT|nr:MAG: hypothetical protein A3G11_01895 [Candidatus Lloydbacteria bacterium RIFCSPLOWO2_12_FULL_51_9]
MKVLYTVLVVLVSTIIATPAQAVKINLNAAVPSHYIVTVDKRSDTAWNIAHRFTPKGKSTMVRVYDFVVFNNSQKGKGFTEITFNKRDNPILRPGKTYAFPTEFTRVKMHEAIALLGNGKTLVEKVEEKPAAPPPYASFTTKGEAAMYSLFFVIIGVVVTVGGYGLVTSIRKLSDTLRVVRAVRTALVATANQVTDVAPQKTATQNLQEIHTQKNSVPLETLNATLRHAMGSRTSTLAEELYALLAKRTVREVAEAFEAGIIPIMGNQGGPVRWVKMHNIPESAKKHPEWQEKLLGDLVASQKALVQSSKEPGADEKTPGTSA